MCLFCDMKAARTPLVVLNLAADGPVVSTLVPARCAWPEGPLAAGCDAADWLDPTLDGRYVAGRFRPRGTHAGTPWYHYALSCVTASRNVHLTFTRRRHTVAAVALPGNDPGADRDIFEHFVADCGLPAPWLPGDPLGPPLAPPGTGPPRVALCGCGPAPPRLYRPDAMRAVRCAALCCLARSLGYFRFGPPSPPPPPSDPAPEPGTHKLFCVGEARLTPLGDERMEDAPW